MDNFRGPGEDVIVIGAGYAGLMAANRILGSLTAAEKQRVRVTVVNPGPDFVERIRLHQLVGGSRRSVQRSLGDLLHPLARVVEGTATTIDADHRLLRLSAADGPRELHWDYVVYAVGSVAAAPIPGAREHAHLVGDLTGASGAATAIARTGPGDKIVVVGGGLTGIEVASEVAEQRPDASVTLVCAGALVPGMRDVARRDIRASLMRLGVRVVEQRAARQVTEGKLELTDGEVEGFDVCLVAASFDVPDLATRSGLPVNRIGRLRVDEELRCVGHPHIFGAGDAAVLPPSVGSHLRMSCAVALPTGAHAADNVVRTLRGQVTQPLSSGFRVQCIALGRKDGYIQLVRPDDTPRHFHVGGRPAAFIKEKICTMVVDVPVREAKRAGRYTWPRGPRTSGAA